MSPVRPLRPRGLVSWDGAPRALRPSGGGDRARLRDGAYAKESRVPRWACYGRCAGTQLAQHPARMRGPSVASVAGSGAGPSSHKGGMTIFFASLLTSRRISNKKAAPQRTTSPPSIVVRGPRGPAFRASRFWSARGGVAGGVADGKAPLMVAHRPLLRF